MKKNFFMVFFLVCITLLGYAQKTEIDSRPDFPIWSMVGLLILVLFLFVSFSWLNKQTKPPAQDVPAIRRMRSMSTEDRLLCLKKGDSVVFSSGHWKLKFAPKQTKKGIKLILLEEDDTKEKTLFLKGEIFFENDIPIKDIYFGSILVQ